jgi:signal transduction histidine kinase
MRNLFSLLSQGFSGLRVRLVVLLLLACAPLVVVVLHTAGEDRRRALTGWRQRSQRVLRLAQRQEEDVLAGTRQLLLAISESAPVRSLDAQRCKRWLDDLVTVYPRYANVGVLTTDGRLLASSAPVSRSENPDRNSFFHEVLETHAFSIGDVSTGTADRKATVTFGYPVLETSGEVLAVVFAELNLNRLVAGQELQTQLPRGAAWIEIDHEGTILARYPDPTAWVGRRLSDPSILAVVANQPTGVVESRDLEGGTRIYAFGSMRSLLASAEVTTLLSIPRGTLFAEADRALLRDLTWLGVAAAVALALGWIGSKFLILRPVRALVKSSARLAAGDLSVRTGMPHTRDELGQLTLAFDQMAHALEQREKERQRASQKLQALSHRLVEVQETERRQIARELHDEIGQSLTATELNLQAALRSPGAVSLERRLEDSIQAVERVLEQVHDLSLNLRPSMLDDLGLEPALRWYTHRQANLIGLRAEFIPASLEERLDPVIETECFRVAQEALTNVVRHAKAREVTVELSRRNGHLHLSVRDDGIGFEVSESRDEAVRGASLGLLSMEERASLAGGGFELNSQPGQGTEVHAWFPLRAYPVITACVTDD